MADLATFSVTNAILILKSSVLNKLLNPTPLASVYCHHSHSPDFMAELNKPRESQPHIPTLREILRMADIKGIYQTILDLIQANDALRSMLQKETSRIPPSDVPKEEDPYQLLAVEREANQKEIKIAYHKKAREFHPDKAGPKGEEMFKKIGAAYEILKDSKKRCAWDKQHPVANNAPAPR